MAVCLFLIYLVFTLIILYHAAKPVIWEAGTALYLLTATFYIGLPWFWGILLWLVVIGIDVLIRVQPVRDAISEMLFQTAGKSIPKLSKTEEQALNAGDTWLEQDIFRGRPNWERLRLVSADLTAEEQAFLDEETEQLCALLDEWQIGEKQDLSPKAWAFIKEKGFFGLVIPKGYGGKGFSARAHSDVVMKLATRSSAAAVTVMVPNSLGPGELLNYYGTEAQKSYYLPRLAKGEEIPCFALTEPGAGSDATSIQAEAIVVKKKVDGKSVLGLNITLDKRWITLAPVATLIGLAVNLRDPDGLLKGEGSEGITCLLIPRDTPNLQIGNRHLPANQGFMNGTIRGQDIFAPIDSIIGGQKKAGQGWQMLVECLSIGRSISLPALGAASSAVAYLGAGAFARIRKQFSVEIGSFEGIEEKLAEVAGLSYLTNATRLLTVAAVNEHKKPSVASAITKYFNTECSRLAVNAAMDVHGGRAVVNGPRNYLTNHYYSLPISITVEGANIMTRNLLIFGQGSMACHPFIRDEFYAISREDKQAFGKLIWQHIHYFMSNTARALCSAWTGGRFIRTPHGALKAEYRKLARLSHAFAWMADLSLMVLGGDLKRRERLSARLADAMSYLYMAMACLRFYQKQGEDLQEKEHAQWAVRYCFYQAQRAMLGLSQNFPNRPIGWLMRLVALPFGQSMAYPSDKMGHKLARTMQRPNHYRDSLKKAVYLSGDPNQPLDRVEQAWALINQNQDLYKKVPELKRYQFRQLHQLLQDKVAQKQISASEADSILATEKARWDAILVDEFAFDNLQHSLTNQIPTPFDS